MSLTRRTLFRALPLLGAAAATPAVAAPLAETPAERVERLSEELSLALTEWCNGRFMAVIEPENNSRCPVLFVNISVERRRRQERDWLNTAEPGELADWHLMQLATAMQKQHGGAWRGAIHTEAQVAVVMMDRNNPQPGVMIDHTHR